MAEVLLFWSFGNDELDSLSIRVGEERKTDKNGRPQLAAQAVWEVMQKPISLAAAETEKPDGIIGFSGTRPWGCGGFLAICVAVLCLWGCCGAGYWGVGVGGVYKSCLLVRPSVHP